MVGVDQTGVICFWVSDQRRALVHENKLLGSIKADKYLVHGSDYGILQKFTHWNYLYPKIILRNFFSEGINIYTSLRMTDQRHIQIKQQAKSYFAYINP